mmetsp:Transcript_13337/g.38675  ORF Transcript_13337/g.38675 Transcript_13337/m.38675 type:complete len:220 (+) Transcript_13337:909-1568(+)
MIDTRLPRGTHALMHVRRARRRPNHIRAHHRAAGRRDAAAAPSAPRHLVHNGRVIVRIFARLSLCALVLDEIIAYGCIGRTPRTPRIALPQRHPILHSEVAQIVREPAHDTPRARSFQKIKAHALFLRVDTNDVRHVVTELAPLTPPALAFGEVKADLFLCNERRRSRGVNRLPPLNRLHSFHSRFFRLSRRRLLGRPQPSARLGNRLAAVLRCDRFLP